ncbi:MAG TPA: M64 family metallopeptidase [Kofleriaceae bacterium]|nr:M64 family metallopeptidase [Kofleriaceae bacterium]
MLDPTRIALAALACGCAGAAPPAPPPAPALAVTLRFDAGGLAIADITTHAAVSPFTAPGAPLLHYQLVAASATLASGTIADPRIAHFEAFDGATPAWMLSSVGFGSAQIALPPRAGTLIVTDGAGELGRVAFDPSMSIAQPLLSMPDVLDTVKLVDHGPAAGHLNLVIMAEGYTQTQIGEFDAAVANFIGELQQLDGFAQHWDQINIWRIDVRSQVAGSGSGGVPTSTAFDTAYDTGGIHRLLAIETQGARDAAQQLRAGVQADAAIVLVNSTDYGGSGDGGDVLSVIYAGDAGDGRGIASIAAHELGHSIWKLADEYEDAALCTGAPPPAAANVSLSPAASALPWASLLTPGVPLPTAVDDPTVVGAYEGAAYCATGRFRPQHDCRMRDLAHGYCAVCRDQIDQYFLRLDPQGGGGSGGDSAPVPVTGLSPDGGSVVAHPTTLSWAAQPGIASYWIVLGHWDDSGTWVQDATWNSAGASSVRIDDAASTSYEFAIDACGATSCADWSSYASFVTGP